MMLTVYRHIAPLWAGGSTDPSYGYLLNSLMAAELRVPVKTDHPGIPLELVGAVVLRLRHAFSGSGLTLRDQVLTDPEPFLAATVFALLLVWAAASGFLGWATWRLTRRWPLAAMAQASPFLCFEVLRSGVQVMCEPLLVACASVLSGLILLSLHSKDETGGSGADTAMGVVLGLGVATKIVFAPAVIPALAAAPSRRSRLRILLWAALAFGACLVLIAPRLPETAAWMWHLFARSGYHGGGAATVVDPERYPGGIARLLLAELPLHLAFVTGLAVCLWPRAPLSFPASARRAAWGLFAAWAVTMAAAGKQPQAHYLVTVAGLVPALLVLAFWRVQLSERGLTVQIARAALVVVLAAGVVHATRGARWFMQIRSNAKTGARVVGEAAAGRTASILYGHRVSTIPASLASGDEWTDLVYSADLRRLYPGFLSFDCTGVHAFGEDVTAREVMAHLKPDGTVLLQDAVWRRIDECAWTSALPRRKIASSGRDALYEARLEPPASDTGPWVGGMFVVAGMDMGPGPERWATAPRTSLLFEHEGGPVTVELAAGHSLTTDQGLIVFANGVRTQAVRLPRLPATETVTIPIQARPGWNEVEIVYDAVAPAVAASESPVPGLRTRVRSTVSPFVRFDALRLLPTRATPP